MSQSDKTAYLSKSLLEYSRQDALRLVRLLERMRSMEAADAEG